LGDRRGSSIKVTEQHYAPWVKARQDQMEASVIRSWERDPLIVSQQQASMKHPQKISAREMVN
jgi:hypothetical protein